MLVIVGAIVALVVVLVVVVGVVVLVFGTAIGVHILFSIDGETIGTCTCLRVDSSSKRYTSSVATKARNRDTT